MRGGFHSRIPVIMPSQFVSTQIFLFESDYSPAMMKYKRRDETRHLPWGRLSVSGRRIQRYGFAAGIPIARPTCRRKLRLLFIALDSRSRRTRRVRTKPRLKEWLDFPDRAHQELSLTSTCVFSLRARPKHVVLSGHAGQRAASEPSLGRKNG